MKATFRVEGEVTIVELEGYLDFESAPPLQESLSSIYRIDQSSRVILDLSKLQFVGSKGVSNFVKSLKVFNRLKMRPFYYGVKSEFVRLFRAFEEDTPFEVVEQKAQAVSAAVERYNLWQMEQERSKANH